MTSQTLISSRLRLRPLRAFFNVKRIHSSVSLVPSSQQCSEDEIVNVDVHATRDLIESGHAYIDVRTVEEYKKGHVKASKIFHIPYMFSTPEGRVKNPEFLREVSSACNKEHNFIVGCQSGVRSLSATADMQKAGFKNVCNMEGGYLAWVKSGFYIDIPKEEL